MNKILPYKHNSEPKNFIRNKWIEFATETYEGSAHDFGILTFPAEAMQDLHLFKQNGFIDWDEVETESEDGSFNYKITKGNVRCFENKPTIWNSLRTKLINAPVNQEEFCGYVSRKYSDIIGGKDKTFPVDVVNLDFEGRLYPNNAYPIDNTIKYIFEFQKKHKRNFSLFITWAVVEDHDLKEFKDLINDTIESNLEDPSAANFKTTFDQVFTSLEGVNYERKSVIGVSKIIIKKASQNLFTLAKKEFYVYGVGGGKGKQRMLSLLYNFKFDGRSGKENIIYSNNVEHAMLQVIDIQQEMS